MINRAKSVVWKMLDFPNTLCTVLVVMATLLVVITLLIISVDLHYFKDRESTLFWDRKSRITMKSLLKYKEINLILIKYGKKKIYIKSLLIHEEINLIHNKIKGKPGKV